MGRPSKATPEVIEAICARLAEGESMNAICADADMPNRRTVERWFNADADIAANIAGARAIGLDVMAEKAVHEALTAEDAPLGRLAFDARRWYLSKLAPKRYGDKLALTDGDGKALAAPAIQVTYIEATATRIAIAAPDE
jgi:hypothetical protein